MRLSSLVLPTVVMMNKRVLLVTLIGVIGAFVPIFWGVLSLLFNWPEDWFSRAYWDAVYLTCPFWRISGEKALFLMPLLNGCLYAAIAATLTKARLIMRQGR